LHLGAQGHGEGHGVVVGPDEGGEVQAGGLELRLEARPNLMGAGVRKACRKSYLQLRLKSLVYVCATRELCDVG